MAINCVYTSGRQEIPTNASLGIDASGLQCDPRIEDPLRLSHLFKQAIPYLASRLHFLYHKLSEELMKQEVLDAYPVIEQALNYFDGQCDESLEDIDRRAPFSGLLNCIQEIYIRLNKTPLNSQNEIEALCDKFASHYWPLVNIQEEECAGSDKCKIFFEAQGQIIDACMRDIDATLDTIKIAVNIQIIEDLLRTFETEQYDIRMISIGCKGKEKQQVLPWLLKKASENKNAKIRIDLFDKFVELPEAIKNNASWKWVAGGKYQHVVFPNLSLHVHNTHFPLVGEVIPYLCDAIRSGLKDNTEVIISEHTAGNDLSPVLIEALQRVQGDRFHLLTQSGRPPEVFDSKHPMDSFIRYVKDYMGVILLHQNPQRQNWSKQEISSQHYHLLLQDIEEQLHSEEGMLAFQGSYIFFSLSQQYLHWVEMNRAGENPVLRFMRDIDFDFPSLDAVSF